MAGEWTPSTEDVRDIYALGNPFRDPAPLAAQFDRWLAAHDAEVRAPLEAEVERQKRIADHERLTAGHIAERANPLIEGYKARAEAAEAKVRAVEALADDWERTEAYTCVNPAECSRCLAYQSAVIRLRAALADPTPEPIWLGPGVDSLQADPPPEEVDRG